MEEISFNTLPFPARLITLVFEDFEICECSWDVETSMVLFPGMLKMFQVMFMVKQQFKNKTKRIPWVWIVKRSRMCGIACGKYLGQWALPVSWNHLPEQVQNKYLGKVCCYPVNSRQTQVTEVWWGLARAYWSLFNTLQYLKGMIWSGSDGSVRHCGYANPSDRDCSWTRDPTHASVSHPTDKKKWTQKSAHLVKEDKAAPSQEEEEEVEQKVTTTWSLSLSELCIMGKDFIYCPGEHIIIWLIKCCSNGTDNLESEGREAKHLGCSLGKGALTSLLEKGYKSSAFAGDSCQTWRKINTSRKMLYVTQARWTSLDPSRCDQQNDSHTSSI